MTPFARGAWSGPWPRVEASDTHNEVKVAAELTRLEEKDVELSLHDGVLTLHGERVQQNEDPIFREHWHGRCQRAIQVGPDIDPDKVSASFKNGVLSVTLAKRPEAQARVRLIPISAG